MKKATFIVFIALTFLVEVLLCFGLYQKIYVVEQDSVVINRCRMSVADNFGNESAYDRSLDYVVLDNEGNVLFRTREGLSENISAAVKNADTILDVEKDGEVKGKVLFKNTLKEKIAGFKKQIVAVVLTCSLVQIVLIAAYFFYLKRTITDPFRRMNDFAARVAGGDLDIPLEIDKRRTFGSFTEAFDLMRSELKKARTSEKKAIDDKKELVAKLSHDIKTPVASIKSTSEIGYEVAKDEKTKGFFNTINVKADQITVLVDNLFTSSVQDITEIPVNASEYDSSVVEELLRNADYLKRAESISVPACRVFIDKLRLQQSFDNIFMNSYKYADTKITVRAEKQDEYLVITIADQGPGVLEEELPLLKEKYKRGQNASEKDGAGLGLFLTNYFITNMDGKLTIQNGEPGLIVRLFLRTV